MLNIYKLKKNNLNKNNILRSGYLSEDSKHYPSSTKEWFNSIYLYNKNDQKYLPSFDITVSKIIKRYFNMFSIKLEKSILSPRIANWKRRLKLNKVLLGKPEFKHSNDKVIITIYAYNRELLLLNNKIKSLKRKIIAEYFLKLIIKNKIHFAKINIIKNILKIIDSLKKKLKFLQKRSSRSVQIKDNNLKKSLFFKFKKVWDKYKDIKTSNNSNNNIYLAKSLKYFEYKLEKSKLNYKTFITSYINNLYNGKLNSDKLSNNIINSYNTMPKFKLSRLMYLNILKKIIIRIRLYLRYLRIAFFNKSKFNIHMVPLKIFLEKLYKKEVEFNIVNLKSYHLDSNILTQIMAIKLKNRKNKYTKIIHKTLNKVKIPLTRRLQYHKRIPKNSFIQNLLINQLINNNYYNLMPNVVLNELDNKTVIKSKQLNIINSNNDKLDMILKVLYPIEYTISGSIINKTYVLKRNLENTTLDSIKNKIVTGIRIEASGRLSKRITASKSIFKMKQKGTIRNINSSYKKLSCVLLRGNFKSNLQLSKINNKTRIGSFGLKGWIGSI